MVVDKSDKLHGAQAVEFMERSGMPREVLHQIWCAVDPTQQGFLNFDAFCMAMRLISHAQSNPSAAALTTELMMMEPPSLPNFEGLQRRRSPSECSTGNVSVANIEELPRVMGSTLDPIRAQSFSYMDQQDAYAIRPQDLRKYASLFLKHDCDGTGFIEAGDARDLLMRSGLTKEELAEVWRLSDVDNDGRLSFREFIVAMHLVTVTKKRGRDVPRELPDELDKVFDASYHIDNPELIMQQPRPPGRSASPIRGRSAGGMLRSVSGSRSRGASPALSFGNEARGRSPTRRGLPSFGYEPAPASRERRRSESREQTLRDTRDVQRLDGIIEADRRLGRYLQREVDAICENVQTLKDIAANLERETRREARDRDRLRQQRDDFVRQLTFSKKRLENLKEERHKLSLESISIRRDRDHYSEEAAFLARAVEAAQKDLTLFGESEMQVDKAFHQCDAQIQELERKRREVQDELKQEKDRMRQDERTNAEIKAKIDRLQREVQSQFVPEVSPREKPRGTMRPEVKKSELPLEPSSTEHTWAAFLRSEADRTHTGDQAAMQYERRAPMASFREGV